MIKIVLIGSGNVATHLYKAFSSVSDVEIIQVFARTQSSAIPLAVQISNWKHLKEADLYVISVSDDAIAEVALKIPFKNKLIVHTSGTTSIDVLPFERKGVFYPLQTFSKEKQIDFSVVPICIETNQKEDENTLQKIASLLTPKVYLISSEQRKALHVAAVFVCNFTNHLYQIGATICENNAIPFEIVKPLITETADKIQNLAPKDAQTGPAFRGDEKTIQAHLELLTNSEYKILYQLMTQSIQHHVKKL